MLSKLHINRVVLCTKRVLARRPFSVLKDATGNLVKCSEIAMEHLDDGIIEMLSNNRDARPRFSKALESDEEFNFARILSVFETLRYDWSGEQQDAQVKETLQGLEIKLSEGKLSKREGWYAAAALAWSEGKYVQAGAILESSLRETSGDLLAAKLAQDAYMTGGLSEHALGAVIRHRSMTATPQHLSGYLLGLLATGYLETGRLQLAEDDGSRAVGASRGQNCWGVHALLNAYQLASRSSEIHAKLDEFERKHEGSSGLSYLYYNRGCAHIMRGNYSGAFKTIEELVTLMVVEVNGVKTVLAPVWTNAVLLLWQLSLNTHDISPNVFDPMWKVLAHYIGTPRTPMQHMCVSIVLSSASVARPVTPPPQVSTAPTDTSTSPTAAPGSKSADTKTWWEQLTRAVVPSNPNKPRKVTGDAELDSLEAQRDSLRLVRRHIVDNYRGILASHPKEEGYYSGAFDAHLAGLNALDHTSSSSLELHRLKSIRPTVTIVQHPRLQHAQQSSIPASATDLQFALGAAVAPLSVAIHAFNQNHYGTAAEMFQQFAPQIQLLGGTAAQRMVFQQMNIESLHRSGDLGMTALLLHERSVLTPQDAQCWRRLATIYGQTGQEALAKQAHYTAWQLGIGQGGFGGPR